MRLVYDDEREMVWLEVFEPLADALNEADNNALTFMVVFAPLDAHRFTGDGHQVVASVLEQLFEVSQHEHSSLPLLDELAEKDRLAEPGGENNQRRPVRLQVPEATVRGFLLVVPKMNELARLNQGQSRARIATSPAQSRAHDIIVLSSEEHSQFTLKHGVTFKPCAPPFNRAECDRYSAGGATVAYSSKESASFFSLGS